MVTDVWKMEPTTPLCVQQNKPIHPGTFKQPTNTFLTNTCQRKSQESICGQVSCCIKLPPHGLQDKTQRRSRSGYRMKVARKTGRLVTKVHNTSRASEEKSTSDTYDPENDPELGIQDGGGAGQGHSRGQVRRRTKKGGSNLGTDTV